MDPGPLRDALTVLLGVATGALSGLFGVGGAVISTPGIRALGASALIAVGTTLPSIIPGAATGTARYLRERIIDWRVVRATAPAGIAASVLGSILTRVVPGEGHVLQLLTAGLLLWSAVRMGRSPGRAPDPETAVGDSVVSGAPSSPPAHPAPSPAPAAAAPAHATARFAAVGGVAGLLSGLLGIGGGVVMVPGFVTVAGMRVKEAIATSLACVGIFAVPGTVTHWLRGDIDWRFALLLAVGVIPGARLGAALAIRATDNRLRVVVAGFLGITAVIYAGGEVLALT